MREPAPKSVPEPVPKLAGHGITGLLLAAGFSRRFGSDKLMSQINGRTLIEHSAAALAPCDRIVAVTRGDNHALLARLDELGIAYVINPEPSRGMAYSIACGVKATPESDGWCILPADMPYLSATTTAQVVAGLREGKSLLAPFHQGRRGHPVGFGGRFRDALAALDGDGGARSIVEQHAEQLVRLIGEDAGVLRDVDIPSELRGKFAQS